MSTQDLKTFTWETLQKKTAAALLNSTKLQNRLMDIKSNVEEISIFRPLFSFNRLKSLSVETDKLNKEFNSVVKELDWIIKNTPDRTMGETLGSCLDTIRLSTEISRSQSQWSETKSAIQQTGAFAFAIFSLYVSLISFFISLLLDLN